ncbi:MAG: ABC transporter permease [Myxococcota bacterium]|nr:ABC transporter permease [Myxococcota bacterium]
MGYAFRRLGFYLIAFWAAITLNFLLPRLMPGDPATVLFARFQGRLKPEALEALKQTFGVNEAPIWEQYGQYLSSLLTGDLGTSLAYFPQPVHTVLFDGVFWTLFLSGGALLISFVLGTLLGAMSAWWRGGKWDYVPAALSFLGAFPYFWMAMLVLAIFGFQLGWFPTRHAYSGGMTPSFSFSFVYSMLQHAFLPGLTMVIASLGGWLLTMRSSMIASSSDEFVLFAHARGLKPNNIMLQYAARVAFLPSLSGFGMALGFVVSGALLTEMVFAYPGQGYLLIQAVRAQDYPLMQGIFLSISACVLLVNWIVDCSLLILDPRTRAAS